MKPPRSLKQKLTSALPLSSRLFLKRVLRYLNLYRTPESHAHKRLRAEPATAGRDENPYVFVFDDRVPTPDRDAGSARMMFILKSLAEWSRPVFVPLRSTWAEYEKLLWAEGIETVGPLDYLRLLKRRKFHAAILSRPDVAEGFLSPLRRRDPSIRIVYDMVDAHFVRLAREYALTGDPETVREAERYRRREARLARASDLVWCASAADEEALTREAPGVRTVVVPTIHQPDDDCEPFERRQDLLFIGSLFHRPNTDGLLFYLREIHPFVRRELPDAVLHIVGDGAGAEVLAYGEADGVRVHGYVPDALPIFRGARVLVAPLRYGAGAKGKVGEALAHGLPVVTTHIGAEGMGFTDGRELIIADSPQEFAAAVARLYNDRELWQSLSAQGRAFVAQHLSPRAVSRIINESVRDKL